MSVLTIHENQTSNRLMMHSDSKTSSDWLPRLSIVTPTFNSATHLEQTIHSVLKQGYPDLEYIIIDGGSTDGTLDLIQHYNTEITYSISEPDAGIADAFNKGIAAATGDVIGIINSDDFYAPHALQRVAQRFLETRNQLQHDLFLLHGDLHWLDGRGSRRVKPRRWPGAIHYDMPVLHPTCFVPRTVYEAVGLFDTGYRLAMDYDWLLRCWLSGVQFEYIPEVLAHFRAGGASTRSLRACHWERYRSQWQHGLNPLVCTATMGVKIGGSWLKSQLGYSPQPVSKAA